MAESAQTIKTQIAEECASFYADPLGFVLWAFDWGHGDLDGFEGPDVWQRNRLIDLGNMVKERAFDGVTPVDPIRFATSSGHGIGKSAYTSWIILWIMSTRPYAKGVVTANTSEQLKTKTWAELGKWKKRCITGDWFEYNNGKGNMNLYHPKYPESWRVDAQTCREENSESFAGLHAANSTPFYIYDEASAVPDVIWEVSEGGLTDGEPMWFAFGNPTRNSGRFHSCFNDLAHRWNPLTVDSREAKMTNKALLDTWIDDYGEDSDFVRVRVKGQFPRAGSNQFIDSDRVHAARMRTIAADDPTAEKVLAVDVARFGDDQSVISYREGFRVMPHHIWKYRGIDTMELASRVAALIDQFNPDAVFVDGAGVGGGVVDRLRQLGYRVVDVIAGSAASDPDRYSNKRAEMWGRYRDWLLHADIPDDKELIDGSTGIEYGYGPKGQLMLEQKKDMKRRGLDSPDTTESIVYGFAEKVASIAVTTAKKRRAQKQGMAQANNYNPMKW